MLLGLHVVLTLQFVQSNFILPPFVSAVPAVPVKVPDEFILTPVISIHPNCSDHALPPSVPEVVFVTPWPEFVGLKFTQP